MNITRAEQGNDPESVDQALRGLVDWAVHIRPKDIPSAVLAHAALGIADSITVATTTRDEPEVVKFRQFSLSRGCRREATVFCAPIVSADREWAALVNAMAMTTAELDGGYDKTSCHAALYTVPALLAEAEAANLSVLEMLRAEVLVYELITRIALAWAPHGGSFPPLYTHARFSAIGAGAASALARGADSEMLLRTLNIAATLITVGPRNHLMRGALVRNVWPAAGTWNGMMAAQWAECGIDGLASSVHDVYTGVLGFPADAAQLSKHLGTEWAVMHGYVRLHACHLFLNTLVEALLEVRSKLLAEDSMDLIDEITIDIHKEALHLTDICPATSLAARFSVPHVAATTLVHGHAGTSAFASNTLSEPRIANLRKKVRVRPFDMAQAQGHHWPAAVQVKAGNSTFRAMHVTARGGHGEPYAMEDVLGKIDALTATLYPEFGAAFREVIALSPQRLQDGCSEFLKLACRARV